MSFNSILKSIFYRIPYISKKDRFYIERRRHKKFLKLEKEFCDFESNAIGVTSPQKAKVFVFWYQGYDAAPKIVKKCISSIRKYTKEYDFVFIDKTNLPNVCNNIPRIIWEKFDKGIISVTHFSDILRFYLLSTFGGIWIDATCLLSNPIPEDIIKSSIFFFKSRINLDGDSTVSTWFISSCFPNPIVKDVYDMLVLYWNKHNKLIDYFLCHYLITISFKKHEDFWFNIPFYHNSIPHYIQYCLLNKQRDEKFEIYLNKSFIHKLTYKIYDSKKLSLFEELNR